MRYIKYLYLYGRFGKLKREIIAKKYYNLSFSNNTTSYIFEVYRGKHDALNQVKLANKKI